MMKHMDEITKAEISLEDSKRQEEEATLRKSCMTQIDQLYEAKNSGYTKFLNFLHDNYKGYGGKTIKVTD